MTLVTFQPDKSVLAFLDIAVKDGKTKTAYFIGVSPASTEKNQQQCRRLTGLPF